MEKTDKIKQFINEISWIKNGNLREFAKDLISNADDYFFIVPASSSGKYHPTFDLGNGGLVRHTKCVAFFAKTMAESLDFNDYDTDLLIISALAHDIKKQGDGAGYTVREHPILGAEYVEASAILHPDLITTDDVKKISGAIRSHMGRWEHRAPWVKGEPYPMPETEFEKALQAADYVASRKEILSFNFGDECINENISTNETMKPQTSVCEPKDYIINFGKHKGKTLEEIKSTGYLEWMVSQKDFFCSEAQEMARAYLNKSNKNNIEDLKNPDITDDLPF